MQLTARGEEGDTRAGRDKETQEREERNFMKSFKFASHIVLLETKIPRDINLFPELNRLFDLYYPLKTSQVSRYEIIDIGENFC